MELVLHLGAHRTASTSFQRYMRAIGPEREAKGIDFWGPCRTRKGLFHRVGERTARDRDRGRVALAVASAARQGCARLLVSDENMIGTVRGNIRAGQLYPEIGERMARFCAAFGPVARVVLQIRSHERYWASALAFALPRGMDLPAPGKLAAIAAHPRGWRGVIEDLAAALPGTEILVTPFEGYAARPDRLLAQAARCPAAPRLAAPLWINRSPDLAALREVLELRGLGGTALGPGEGRWMPFLHAQAMALREAYQDDIYWLRAGASGLARYEEDPDRAGPAEDRPPAVTARGRRDETDDGRLAGVG